MISMPSMPSVPLRRARPSLLAQLDGLDPVLGEQLTGGPHAPVGPLGLPPPIRVRAQWESGARSPEQPREPYSCTTGVMPAFSTSAMVCATSGRTPVCPEQTVLSRRNIRARTTSRSTRGPIPAACERDDVALQLGTEFLADVPGRQGSEAGGDAVDRVRLGRQGVHDLPGRRQGRHRLCRQLDAGTAARHGENVGRRDTGRPHHHSVHIHIQSVRIECGDAH